MALAEFAKTQWQIAVALDTLVKDDDVAGAVHRLQGEVAFLALGHEHVFAVLVPVTGFLPQTLVQDLRPLDLLVAVVTVNAAHVLLHLLPNGPALGMPENRAGRVFVDMEQIEFATEFAVVAFFGFFKACEVLL